MNRNGCRENAETLIRYSAGELQPEERAALEEHLGGCEACREAASAHQAVWAALDSWSAPPVTPGFDRKLYERIAKEAPWWRRWSGEFLPRRWVPVAAAAGLVSAALVLSSGPGAPVRVEPQVSITEPRVADEVQSALEDMDLLREFDVTARADSHPL